MRIKIGKSSIRGGELAEGLGVGAVAAQVGAGTVDLLHRAFDSINGQAATNPFADPNFGKDPSTAQPSTANPFADPNFGAAPATAAPATPRPPASQPNPFADPDFGK